ncbi:MAG: hypothetical protein QOH88_3628 [Verrucomicrobiota bacterium]|jgi:hypothetical protein
MQSLNKKQRSIEKRVWFSVAVLSVPVFFAFFASAADAAEDLQTTRAALKAQLHRAVDAEDWNAVENLKTSLRKLDSAFAKAPLSAPETASSEPAAGEQTFISKVQEAGFHLQLSDTDDNPAVFAFARDVEAGAKTVFTSDFFLSWTASDALAYRWGWRQDAWDMDASVSAQGKLTSTNDTDTDAWRFRATLSGRYAHNALATNPDAIAAFTWRASFKEEASREFDYNRVGGELLIAPTVPAIAMGVYQPGLRPPAPAPSFQFRWRPYLGLDAGTITSDTHNVAKGADDTLWLIAKVGAKLKLNAIARAFNFTEVSLFAEDHYTYLTEAGDSHNYLTAGLNLMMNEYFGFTFSYKVGEDSPKFKKEESYRGAFSVKF